MLYQNHDNNAINSQQANTTIHFFATILHTMKNQGVFMFIRILPFLSILVFRFIGLFIVLPVISLLIAKMPDANMWNVGMAIGAPYLLQMVCQPFFGRWSDKYGRKPILMIGLIVFLIGTIICMFESSIYYLILGRCVQGMGAIGGILTALVADSVKEEKRTGAMALMGIGIFVSFIIAMILGSILGAHFGLNSLFGLSAVVTLISLFITIFFVKPTQKITYVYPNHNENKDTETDIKKSIFAVSLSGFIEKLLMVLTFALVPIILNEHIDKTHFWYIYLPAILAGIVALGPTSVISEKRGLAKEVLLASIGIFFIAYFCMALWIDNIIVFGVGLACFFAAFSIQEALLQSMVSKYAKAKYRGKVIGDFSAAGFGGSFIGAMIGGFFSQYDTISMWHWTLFGTLMICMILWLFVVIILVRNPDAHKTLYIPLNQVGLKDLETLNTLIGVMEWYENLQENLLTIKYNTKILESKQIYTLLQYK